MSCCAVTASQSLDKVLLSGSLEEKSASAEDESEMKGMEDSMEVQPAGPTIGVQSSDIVDTE